jgi:hypothetical protein
LERRLAIGTREEIKLQHGMPGFALAPRYGWSMSTPAAPNDPNAGDPFTKSAGASGNPYSAGPPAGTGHENPSQSYPAQNYPAPGYSGQQPPGQQPYQGQGYPGQPGQQGGYPTQAPYQGATGYPGAYPGGAGLPPEPVRPNTVTWAFWCWIATTVASLITLIITLTSSVWTDAVNAGVGQGIRQSGTSVNIDVQSLVNTVKIISVVAFLIFAAVYLLFAFKMRAGRNWARIVLTVFGALTLLSAFNTSTSSVTVNGQTYASSNGSNWVTVVLALAGIILMYVGQSNKYFADSKARRLGQR